MKQGQCHRMLMSSGTDQGQGYKVEENVTPKVRENVKVKRRRVLSRMLTRADGQLLSVVDCVTPSQQPSILAANGCSSESHERHGRLLLLMAADGTSTSWHETTSTGRSYYTNRRQRPLVRQICFTLALKLSHNHAKARNLID